MIDINLKSTTRTGTIYWDNGQLVVDYTKKNHQKFYRDIEILKNDNNEICVKANKVNYVFLMDYWNILTNEYNDRLFDLIDESYFDTKQIAVQNFCQIILGIKPKKFVSIKTLKDKTLKWDWIEAKKTNIPFEFVTNNYLIIQ